MAGGGDFVDFMGDTELIGCPPSAPLGKILSNLSLKIDPTFVISIVVALIFQ